MPDSLMRGRRILIVEDDFLLADALSDALAYRGATVVGPAATVTAALHLLADGEPALDVAILDVNLGGETSVPVAERLEAQGVPILLATGYDEASLPEPLKGYPMCQKPMGVATWEAMIEALLRQRKTD